MTTKMYQYNRSQKILYWFSLFMAAPFLLLVFNISLYLFPLLALRFKQAFGYYIKSKPLVHIPAVLFIIGAVLSAINGVDMDSSLQVLPNYIYWAVMIIFLSSHARNINFEVIARASFWGVIVITFYYYIQHSLPDIPIFAYASPNGYSFNLICFMPLATHYVLNKKGRSFALAFLLFISLILFTEGRRAGFVLVLTGSALSIYLQKVNFRQILVVLFGAIFIWGALSTKLIEEIIKTSNDRIYGLIYSSEELTTTDVSYLTRIAMVKKGQSIFKDHPYTGIGLNNFTKYKAEIKADFKGARLVLGEKSINSTSAHNSYIALLGEGGLFLFVPFMIILTTILLFILVNINKIPSIHRAVFFGFVCMVIHFYFISAAQNVFAWYLIGLSTAAIYRK